MTLGQGESVESAKAGCSMDALAYEAPFLIEKLLKAHIVDTPEEGQALFVEVKRFFVLVRSDDTKMWEMYSARIDEAWHQFILFTKEYTDFCRRFFGRYIPHSPSNAPKSETRNSVEVSSFQDFQCRYLELFGEPPPDAWYDEKSVKMWRRVFNDRASGTLVLRNGGEMVDLLTPNGDVILSVNEFAREALAFVARTSVFYVRELPGDLNDEEKVALVATLVQYKVLRVGA
jgi:hypothetical protein